MKVLQISKRGLPTEVMELGDISEPDAKAGGLGRRRHPARSHDPVGTGAHYCVGSASMFRVAAPGE
jgi:hypothetical protein